MKRIIVSVSNRSSHILLILPLMFFPLFVTSCTIGNWSLNEKGNILEISYGSGTYYPQYAALHLDSSYFRMNYGPSSGWGTSVILFPSFWTDGTLYQGAPVLSYNWRKEKGNLVIGFSGVISTLNVIGELTLYPPEENSIKAKVKIHIDGNVDLDNRPGEAFKPVMLSSMHISSDLWDAESVYIGSETFIIPQEGWIVSPPIEENLFGINGGLSKWQVTNHQGPVPTIEVTLDRKLSITGWVTYSNNPNDDNVGFWASSNEVIEDWEYTVVARKPNTE